MPRRSKFFFLFLITLIAQPVLAQYGFESGNPFVKNYSAKDYKAEAQNWTFVQDSRGVMYVGNSGGILEFDGAAWRLILLPNQIAVQALEIYHDTGYVGAQGDFGYLKANSTGKLEFQSLLSKAAKEDQEIRDVLSVNAHDGRVFFRTSAKLLVYDGKTVKSVKSKHSFGRPYVVNGSLLVHQKEIGLTTLSGDSLALIKGGEHLLNKELTMVFALPSGQYLIGTWYDGLFIMDPSTGFIKQLETPVNKFLKDNIFYKHAQLPNGLIALATIKGGIVLIDEKGGFVYKLVKNSRTDQ
jgi:hypothetical protein